MSSSNINGPKKWKRKFPGNVHSKGNVCLLLWVPPKCTKAKNSPMYPAHTNGQLFLELLKHGSFSILYVETWGGGKKTRTHPQQDEEMDYELVLIPLWSPNFTGLPTNNYSITRKLGHSKYLHPLQIFEGLLPVLGLQSPLAVLHLARPHMPTGHTLVTPPQEGRWSSSLWCRSRVRSSWGQWNT